MQRLGFEARPVSPPTPSPCFPVSLHYYLIGPKCSYKKRKLSLLKSKDGQQGVSKQEGMPLQPPHRGSWSFIISNWLLSTNCFRPATPSLPALVPVWPLHPSHLVSCLHTSSSTSCHLPACITVLPCIACCQHFLPLPVFLLNPGSSLNIFLFTVLCYWVCWLSCYN